MNKDAVAEISQQYQVEAAEKVVPEGYKQTEVGVIPEDWGLQTIKEISLIPMQNGLFYEPKRKGTGVPLINVGDMYTSAPVDVNTLELFNATAAEIKTFKVHKGDVLFTRSSIVPSGIAYCNIFNTEQNNVVFDSHLIRVRPDENVVYPEYLYLNCIAEHARKALVAEAKTATMTTIDQGAINRCPVLLPPKIEQVAIVNALSDTDALLSELEKLIAKKQAIKTATMQQLLTGRTRLPQFAHHPDGSKKGYKQSELGEIPEDWIIAAIADQHEIATGNTPPTSDIRNYGGNYLFVSPADLGNKKCIDKAEKTLSNKGFALARKFPAGSTLFTCIGSTIGKTGYATVDLTSNQQINAVFPNENHDSNFTYYALTYIAPKIKVLAGEQAVPLVNKTAFGQTLYYLPKKKQEQTAIATILADMDEEIQALEQRLNKTRQIKQGMMQELLTGKTRLVASQSR